MARDTSPTDRRGYERPAIGDDWADAWDGLVEDSDELAVERGPIADRPTTGAYDDALYLATDQRTLWRWDGAASDWEAQAGLGTASDPLPGTSHFESVSTGETTINGPLSYQIENLSDVTGSRNLAEWYQNTSDAMLYVQIDYSVDNSADISVVRLFGDVNNDSKAPSPQDSESVVGTDTTTGFGGPNIIVPSGAYYQIRAFGDTGDGGVGIWREGEFK